MHEQTPFKLLRNVDISVIKIGKWEQIVSKAKCSARQLKFLCIL